MVRFAGVDFPDLPQDSEAPTQSPTGPTRPTYQSDLLSQMYGQTGSGASLPPPPVQPPTPPAQPSVRQTPTSYLPLLLSGQQGRAQAAPRPLASQTAPAYLPLLLAGAQRPAEPGAPTPPTWSYIPERLPKFHPEPSPPSAAAQGIGKALELGGQALGWAVEKAEPVLRALNVPLEKVSLPVVAAATIAANREEWPGRQTREARIQEINDTIKNYRLTEAERKELEGERLELLKQQALSFARAQGYPIRTAYQGLQSYLERNQGRYQDLRDFPEYLADQFRAIRQLPPPTELPPVSWYRNAEENIALYQENTPELVQLTHSILYDPLNLADALVGQVVKGVELARGARRARPVAKSAEQVTRELAALGKQGDTFLARLWRKANPFRLTPEALRASALRQTVDVVNTIAPVLGPSGMVDFLRNPDAPKVLRLTGGFSGSTKAKQAWGVLTRSLGRNPGSELVKIIELSHGDAIQAMARLAQKLEGGLGSLFPAEKASKARRALDSANNIFSVAYMGYLPGYGFRNGLNNALTITVDGANPFQSRESIRKLWERWGPPPVISKQGLGAAGGLGYTASDIAKNLRALTDPMTVWDTFKGLTWKAPTLKWSAQLEAFFSERIVASKVREYWAPIWEREIDDLAEKLVARGVDPATADYYARRLSGALNPQEAARAVGLTEPAPGGLTAPFEGTSPAPPAAPRAAPPAPSVTPPRAAPSGGGEAAAAVSRPAREIVRHFPPELEWEAEMLGGHEMADALREAMETATDPTAVTNLWEAFIEHVDAMIEPSGVVDELAKEMGPPPSADYIIRYMEQTDDAYRRAYESQSKYADQVWALTRQMADPQDKRMAWEIFRSTSRAKWDEFYRRMNDLDASRLPDLNFTDDAIRRRIAFREAQAQSMERLYESKNYIWSLSPPQRAGEWAAEEAKQTAIVAEMQERARRYLAQWQQDGQTAIARSKFTGGEGMAPAPKTPPPAEPKAPATAEAETLAPTPAEVKAEQAARLQSLLRKAEAGTLDVSALSDAERQLLAESLTEKAGLASPPEPPATVPAPSPATGGEVPRTTTPPVAPPAPAVSQSDRLKRLRSEVLELANDAGISTATKSGKPTDAYLMNFARKHTTTEARRFRELTEDELGALKDELVTRVTEKAAPKAAPKAAAARDIDEVLAEASPYLHFDPKTGNTYVKTIDLHVDPERFQYKLDVNAQGVTGQLRKIKKWDPSLGKGISVWVDPEDGRLWVVNGHHRYERAVALGASRIESPYFIQAATAEEARLIGAIQNIAEGRGTPVDAAKVFRELGFTQAELTKRGLALSESNVKKGLALANLNDNLFRQVVQKQLPIQRMVIVGERISDPDLQLQVVDLIGKRAKTGKAVGLDEVKELCDAVASGPAVANQVMTLFGPELRIDSLVEEKIKFYSYVSRRLRKDKSLFRRVSKEAETLRKVGKIDAERAREIAESAERIAEQFDLLKWKPGRISQIGDEAAQAIRNGEKDALERYYEQITEEIPTAFRNIWAGAGEAGATAQGLRRAAENVEPPKPAQTGPSLFDELGARAVGDALGGITDPVEAQRVALSRMRELIDKIKAWARVPKAPPPIDRNILAAWLDNDVAPAMVRGKAITNDLAERARNFALGDYHKKRNLHMWLSSLYPYSYWYTFTYWNWAKRLVRHPEFVLWYMRYKKFVRDQNERWYRQVTGNPNAELPPYWRHQIRIPATDIFVDLERTLNPLYNIIEDFSTRARREAPGGRVMEMLQSFGPTLFTPVVWAYSAWLAQHGYTEAAQQWVGYLTPVSRPIKAATAVAREQIPALRGVIPAGGFAPEQLLIHNVQGGDIWERRRAASYVLKSLLDQGKITEEEYQDAFYRGKGRAYEMAIQEEALRSAPGTLMGWLVGVGFKPRNLQDVQLQQMWDEWYNLWEQKDAVSPERWRELRDQFDEKYPWAKTAMMAREIDPLKKLSDYAWIVLDRLPPGTKRRPLLAAAGLTDEQMERFYQDRGDLTKWTEAEQRAFQGAIELLAQQNGVPSADDREKFAIAVRNHNTIKRKAAEQMGMTVDTLDELQNQYYALPPEQRPAFTQAHPELVQWWDLRDQIGREPAYQETEQTFYTTASDLFWGALPPGSNWRAGLVFPPFVEATLDESTRGTMTEEQLQMAANWLRQNVPEEFMRPEEWDLVRQAHGEFVEYGKQLFGDDILDLSSYYGSLSTQQRQVWRVANPNDYARLKAYWDYKDWYTKANPTWGKYYGFRSRTRGTAPVSAAPSTYATPVLRRSLPSGTGTYTSGSAAAPQEPPRAWQSWTLAEFERRLAAAGNELEGLPVESILPFARAWFNMTESQRLRWQSENPRIWAAIRQLLELLALIQVPEAEETKTAEEATL